MVAISDSIKGELLALAKRRSARVYYPSRNCLTGWEPETVLNPKNKKPFTPEGAWEFIIEHLEKGHPIKEVDLKKYPGKKGYELRVNTPYGDIYIKLRLKDCQIHGMSFHKASDR
jgi:hypothetical protein